MLPSNNLDEAPSKIVNERETQVSICLLVDIIQIIQLIELPRYCLSKSRQKSKITDKCSLPNSK